MEVSPSSRTKTVAFFVTEDWYFCSHRLALANAAREAGYSVYVITRVNNHRAQIESAGLNLIPVTLSRRGMNPLAETVFIKRLVKIYKRIKPDIVHHIALKPVLYGSIAARLSRVPKVVNALAGLGFMFSSESRKARILRPFIKATFRTLLNHKQTTVILQNPDDVEVLCRGGTVARQRVTLIRGSGVDVQVYRPRPEPAGSPVVLLASRLLWDKGVGEFVEAARRIRREYPDVRFALAGDSDDENPAAISQQQLDEWKRQGDVEIWGRRTDMPAVFAGVHLVCLPTAYGEGVPKVLIEAASCARPIVATDAPGCREIVIDGKNGLLVPVRNVDALVDAIKILLDSPELRRVMGEAGRQLVKESFSLDKVIRETLAVYEQSSS